MLFAQSIHLAVLTILTASVQLATALRPHDVYAEEAAAATLTEPKATADSLMELHRLGDPPPPPSNVGRGKTQATTLLAMNHRIWSAQYWNEKMEEGLILKGESVENGDINAFVAALVDCKQATAMIKAKLEAIASLPDVTDVEPGKVHPSVTAANNLLQQVMELMNPGLKPDHENEFYGGYFPVALGLLADTMRKVIPHFKTDEMVYNAKFEYQYEQMKIAHRAIIGVSHDSVPDTEETVDVARIPSRSGRDIRTWVDRIIARVSDQHELFYADGIRSDSSTHLILGPWTALIGYCSKPVYDELRDRLHTDFEARGLLPWMRIIARATDAGSAMNYIYSHWKRHTEVDPTYESSDTEPLLDGGMPKEVPMIVVPAVAWGV